MLLLCPLYALVAPAQAEEALFDGHLVEMLPAGLIAGDGTTAVTLHVIAVDETGGELPSVKWSMKASEGSVDLIESSDTRLTFSFTPPSVDEITTVDLDLRGRSGQLDESIERSWTVTVSPPLPSAMSSTASPSEIILGQDTPATISVTLAGGANQPAKGAALLSRSSSGKLDNTIYVGAGRFSARLGAPTVSYPHLGIITFADERSPDTLYGHQIVKYTGKTDYPVSTEPNATVLLRIGDREFGPIQADASGSAVVPISVSPGTKSGTLISIVNGNTSEFPMDLEVPATRRVAFYPVAKGIPADGKTGIPIRVLVVKPNGAAKANANITLTATAGEISAATHEGAGVYMATYTPPLMNAESSATLQVTLDGASAVQSDSLDIRLTPTLPSSIVLTTDAASLSASGTGFTVYAKVTGPDNSGLDGREITFGANGAKLQGGVSDLRSGDYQATFSTTGSSSVELTGTVHTAPTGNPVRGVVVLPARDELPPDGLSSSMVTVVAVDQFGYPVAGVPVSLSVAAGGGTLPDQVTTDQNGIAQVYYTAGREAGVVSIIATAADTTGGAALLQIPAGSDLQLDLDIGGSAWTAQVNDAWAGIVQSIVVPREGAGTFLSAPAVTTSSGPVTALALAGASAHVAPGASITVNIQAKDAGGLSVSGADLEAMAMPGIAGEVTDLGDGAYAVIVTAPQGTGITELKVVVSTASGEVARVLKVPIKAASVSPWGAATAATEPVAEPVPEVVAEAEPEPEPAAEPSDDSDLDLPWLRVRAAAGLGSYTFAQTPTKEDGPLWNQGLSFEVPARQGGGALDATAWLPMMDWLGADFEARFSYYSAIWPNSAETVVPDLVPHISALAAARYAFETNGNQFHVAGKIGMVYGDFITYIKGETDTQLEYQALGVAGFALGAEIAGEIQEMVFFKAGLVEGLRGTVPFNANVDVEVGYNLLDNIFVSANYALSTRSIEVLADPSEVVVGQLADTSHMFLLGVGYQM